MKRHRLGRFEPVENKQVDAFLTEIVRVSKEHGLSLSHEDTQGAFIVEKYSQDNIQWLMDAIIGNSLDAA